MTSRTRPAPDVGRLIMGFNLMLVGVLCWLYQLGHLSRVQLFGFWPLALVGLGLAGLLDPRRRPGVPVEGGQRNTRSGWGLVLVGVALILGNLLLPDSHSIEIWLGLFPLRLSWPLLLVVVGGYMIWRDRHPARKDPCACDSKGCC